MEGTITQLGLKNYLTDPKRPKVSFFSHGYKNYGNYAKDTRKLNFLATADFGKQVSFRFDQDGRYGDLITNLTLQYELPQLPTTSAGTQVVYTNGVGNAIIKELTLKIGGNVVETHGAEWMDIWSTLSIPESKKAIYNSMIKKSVNSFANGGFRGGNVYSPLMLWFCQNMGSNTKENIALNLPLIGMRNCEIELIIKFRSLEELVVYNRVNPADTSTLSAAQLAALHITESALLVDYMILEPDERVKYLDAQRQMYLITQSQKVALNLNPGESVINMNLRELRYPITELIWVIRSKSNLDNHEYFNYTNSPNTADPNRDGFIKTLRMTFDGRDRIPELRGDYFTDLEPFKVHDSVPPRTYINCWSFALDPENLAQPTGSCNFSGINEAKFIINLNTPLPTGAEISVFAINYNVMQMDNKGNVWLLHNMSKDTPGQLPDLSKPRYIDECMLGDGEYKRVKQIIAEINEQNLFTDPTRVDNSIANLVVRANRVYSPTNGVLPFLDALHDELQSISTRIAQLKAAGKKFKDSETRQAMVGGMRINMDDIDGFLEALSGMAADRMKAGRS
jgi:hypothetical protein